MAKSCDICKKPIPDDFQNLLCWEHYNMVTKDNDRIKEIEEEERKSTPIPPGVTKVVFNPTLPSKPLETPDLPQKTYNKNGITDPNYQENPEKDDKEQWKANVIQFDKSGHFLWHPTREMYEFIKTAQLDKITQHPQYPKFIWKPKIVDVGCGTGAGSNLMSQEADFVWGIDKNEKSVQFAKQLFTREKNNIYYSAQVTFDHIDIVEDTREFMKFDIVVAIEVIEHINDYKKFLRTIIDKFAKKDKSNSYDVPDPTEFYISSPNRYNAGIQKDKPKNAYHVREWTSEEYYSVLSEFFKEIKFLTTKGEPVDIHTATTPLLAKCSNPK